MSLRIHQLAKELGVSSKELIAKLAKMKIKVKGHMSAIDDKTADLLRKGGKAKTPEKPVKVAGPEKKVKDKVAAVPVKEEGIPKKEEKLPKTEKEILPKKEDVRSVQPVKKEVKPVLKKLEVDYPVTVKQLSIKVGVKPSEIIARLIKKNLLVTINQNLDEEIVKDIACQYGYDMTQAKTLEEEITRIDDEVMNKAGRIPRSPVVTFMGHVDHGKTSLLDYIRKTKITAKEKGGITQHIGAYKVNLVKGSVTFLDTPGHAAFTAMRARGANATDVAVIVIAADDGVMPQTREAIDHARVAGVPIVVALNKCDLPDINYDKIKRQLSELDLMPEDWGGKTIMVPVSAKTGQGIDNLLEMLLLESELLELKANPTIRARGVVIEGKLSPGKGVIATLLVKNGTLKLGDTILSGLYYGRIKAMNDDHGCRIEEVPPSSPVEVMGLQGLPEAGDEFFVVKDEKKARTLSVLKQQERRNKVLGKATRISLEHLYEQIKQGGVKELKIILKADVQGSVEALQKSLENLSTSDVKLKAVHVGVGNINESDVMLAVVSNAVVIGFHVKIDPRADEIAKKEEIEVKKYDIIYEAISDVQAAMEGLLEPILKEMFLGRAKVQQVFKVSKIGLVAGCIVTKGAIARPNPVRLIRGGEEIYKGKIRSLKRFKDDAREVKDGVECGIALENTNDYKAGDLIESFVIEKIARRLDKR